MQNVMTVNLEQPGGWERLVNDHARVAEQIRQREQLSKAIDWDTEARESYNALLRQRKRNAKKSSDRYWRKCEKILISAYSIVIILALVILLEVENVITSGVSVPVALTGMCCLCFLTGWYFHMLSQRRTYGK